jgi:hypothetical protein
VIVTELVPPFALTVVGLVAGQAIEVVVPFVMSVKYSCAAPEVVKVIDVDPTFVKVTYILPPLQFVVALMQKAET